MYGETMYCNNCAHYLGSGTCEAFDDEENGIPYEIMSGWQEHDKPLPGQGNDIVFEPLTSKSKLILKEYKP